LAYSGAYRHAERTEDARPEPEMAKPGARPVPHPNEGMAQRLMPFLQKLEAIDLQTDDLLLLLILYLMYRESGDKELLFMMGAMLLP